MFLYCIASAVIAFVWTAVFIVDQVKEQAFMGVAHTILLIVAMFAIMFVLWPVEFFFWLLRNTSR